LISLVGHLERDDARQAGASRCEIAVIVADDAAA
jgi:hypothetical protein